LIEIVRGALPCDAFYMTSYNRRTGQESTILLFDTLDGHIQTVPRMEVEINREGVYYQTVIEQKKPLLLHRDSPNSETAGFTSFGNKQKRSASLLFVPMILGENIVGVMSVQSYQPHAYNPHHVELFKAIASQTAPALEAAFLSQQLSRNQERMNLVMDSVSAAVFSATVPDMGLDYISPGIEDLSGYSSEKFLEDPFFWRQLVHPEDQERMAIEQRKTLQKEEPTDIQIRIIHRDSRPRWLHIRANLERNQAGRPVSFYGIAIDITRHKHSEEAMEKAARMEATATLAGGIAHEFNNLMVGVLGNAELARIHYGDRPDAVKMLDKICSSAQKAGDLAQQMLAFARGGRYLTRPLDFNIQLKEILRLQQKSMPNGIQIDIKTADALWPIVADPSQVSQVIVNLCNNAVEAIGDKGRIEVQTENRSLESEMEIDGRTLPPGNYVYLRFEDNGCGMDEESLGRIFEPFYSTKFRGRGLGLAAVYGIVSNHGGAIFAESQPRLRTVFHLYFPAQKQQEKNNLAAETKPQKGNETILVVDDEDLVVDVTRKILELEGYQVLVAKNGREAVEIARDYEGNIHLALLDMTMPESNAVDCFPHLKKARPNMKVILSSGYDLDESARQLLDEGAIDFLQKPFRIDVLYPAVRKALDG
jgi:two-component system, cell cycle sensor histidine kinase and response regulator CckA